MKIVFYCLMLWAAGWGQGEFWSPIPSQRSTNPSPYDQARSDLISNRVRNADTVGIFWVGNSITHFWENAGSSVWNQFYSDRYPLNAGISGDRTQGVLNRFLNGNMDWKPGVHPHVAIVMIGTNNIGWDPSDTPEQTLEGVRAVLQLMIRRMPYTRILLLGIFPRGGGNGNGSYMDQIATINDGLEGFADDNIIHYLDIGHVFLNNNGSVNGSLMPDQLHPNAEGYVKWAEAMEPKLVEMLEMDRLEAIRIMPLGNSITEGTSTKESYRFHLDAMLRKAGYHFDFVGSLKKHQNNGKDPESYEYDLDHEGHWAREADWLLPRVHGFAEEANPDMVLLHIGTNDINHESGTPEEVTDRTVEDISGIIDSLRDVNPNVSVLLAKIIPTTANEIPNANDVIDMLNAKLETLVEEMKTEESLVYLVDQNTGFDTNSDMVDPYHPNESGAKKMAEVWLSAIEEVMDTSGQIVANKKPKEWASKLSAHPKKLLLNGFSSFSDICKGCSAANVYDLKGHKLFNWKKGTTPPSQYRGLVLIKAY